MRIKRLFHFFDFDRDRKISQEDLYIRLHQLGSPYSEAHVRGMFAEVYQHLPLFHGRVQATHEWLRSGDPKPDLMRGSLLVTARPTFFGDEHAIKVYICVCI